jgi:peptide/nickel transport system permease protein
MNNEQGLRPAERKAMQAYYSARYGLDKPLFVQYLNWLNHVSPVGVKSAGEGFPGPWKFGFKAPDFGESFATHRPVSQMLGEAVPITLLLECLSLPLIYFIAIWTGIVAAKARGEMLDVGLGFTLIGMYSLPTIWIGVLMIGFLCNDKYIHIFPTNGLHDLLSESMAFLPSWSGGAFHRGWLLDMAWHLLLPVICLSYGSFAYLSRLQRGALLEALAQDYVRTARAKGLPMRVVIYRHAFRNSLMPLITVAASILPGMIGGAVIVEHIFGIQGMGRLALDSVFSRDREVLMAVTLIAGVLQVIGNLLSDLTYAIADPRVSYVD